MNSQFKRGILLTLAFYLIGGIITVITHTIWGWEYPHAPPPSSLVVLIFLVLGLLRAIWNIKNIKNGTNKDRNIGELIVNALPTLSLIILIVILIVVE